MPLTFRGRISAAFLCFPLAACSRGSKPAVPATAAVDSVVLERTVCFGTCPAYRLSLARDGVIHFQSKSLRDSSAAVTDRVSPSVLDSIVAHADRIRFAEYPDDIRRDQRLCKDFATDHPSIIIGVFGARAKQVVYYTGCYTGGGTQNRAAELDSLAELANRIDSLTRSSRWVRPSAIR